MKCSNRVRSGCIGITLGLFALMALLGGCSDSESTAGAACFTSDDCPSVERCRLANFEGRYDSFAEGVCVEQECFDNDDCPMGPCRDNVCYVGDGAADSSETSVCDFDSDCGEGEVCDQEDFVCVPEGTDLCADVTCPTGQRCEEGLCVEEGSVLDPCLDVTCGTEQICVEGDCIDDPAATCSFDEDCEDDEECIEGRCRTSSGESSVVDGCESQTDCPSGLACNRQTGECIEIEGCEGVTCSGSTPILEPLSCRCVGCEVDADCNDREFCTPNNRCLFEGSASCSNDPSECPAGTYCQAEACVDCITPSDCVGNPDGEICIRGRCGECECPEGERCTATGDCVPDIILDGPCDTNGDCRERIIELDLDVGDIDEVQCDPDVGCMVVGTCNTSVSQDDPFDAACAAGTSCEGPGGLGLFEDLLGAGGSASSCAGCNPGDPSTCRQGETCQEGCLFALGPVCLVEDDGPPRCLGEGGDGGDFPFPF